MLLESGSRFTELVDLVINFDESKLEKENKIILYRNFYLRGNKSSYYLFFQEKTFKEFLKIRSKITSESYLESFRDRIMRNKSIVSSKYLRKYNFTLMVEAQIPFEIANFIQGRASKNVGFNHYLAKRDLAVKEYKKIKF